MRRVIAIDTSAGTSIAVAELTDSNVVKLLGAWHSGDAMKHAENVGTGLASALTEAGLAPTDLDAVVVGRGPAPFTGLRVGIAAAVMFAEGIRRPLYGVVSLDAIARSEAESEAHVGGVEQLLVTTDARRGEVYWATYGNPDAQGQPVRLAGPSVGKLAAVLDGLEDSGTAYRRAELPLDALALAQVFFAQHLAGTSSTDVTALYLREPDAVPSAAKKVSG